MEMLKKYYPIKHKEELMKIFPDRSYGSIQAQAERFNISSTVRYWTKKDVDYLIAYYSSKPREEMVQKLARTWVCIRQKAMILNIKRPKFINKNFAPPRNKHRSSWRRYYLKKLSHKCQFPNCKWIQTVEINHIDGNRDNWNENNIEILCPNHHSITPTHSHQGHRYYTKS